MRVHGFRYYDPEIGRYLTRDPIGYGDGLNVYLYVGNNPINGIDPTGLAELLVHAVHTGVATPDLSDPATKAGMSLSAKSNPSLTQMRYGENRLVRRDIPGTRDLKSGDVYIYLGHASPTAIAAAGDDKSKGSVEVRGKKRPADAYSAEQLLKDLKSNGSPPSIVIIGTCNGAAIAHTLADGGIPLVIASDGDNARHGVSEANNGFVGDLLNSLTSNDGKTLLNDAIETANKKNGLVVAEDGPLSSVYSREERRIEHGELKPFQIVVPKGSDASAAGDRTLKDLLTPKSPLPEAK